MALAAATVLVGIRSACSMVGRRAWRFPATLPERLTPSTWMRLGDSFGMVLRDTLVLAAASSLAATALALGTLERAARIGLRGPGRALRALYVPLIAPQVAFLFGLQILFSFAGVDGTFLALAIVHLVFVFPYVLLSLSDPGAPGTRATAMRSERLGTGANAVFWRVRLPMLARPVLTAAALGFAVSVALYLPTLSDRRGALADRHDGGGGARLRRRSAPDRRDRACSGAAALPRFRRRALSCRRSFSATAA